MCYCHILLTFQQEHGDIIYLSVFSQGIIVLNSQNAAMELLGSSPWAEKSAGRPMLTMASELYKAFVSLNLSIAQFLFRSGYDRFLALHQHTDRHRAGRTYLHSAIGPQHARHYAPAQEEQSVRFLRKLLENPDDLEEHCKW